MELIISSSENSKNSKDKGYEKESWLPKKFNPVALKAKSITRNHNKYYMSDIYFLKKSYFPYLYFHGYNEHIFF